MLSLLTQLKQICNHPAHFLKEAAARCCTAAASWTRLTEMLEEALSVGDHALVFTQFVEMGTLLQHHLRDRLQTEVLFLHGGTSAAPARPDGAGVPERRRPAHFRSQPAGGRLRART